MQWHQLDDNANNQTTCTSLQTDNHTNTLSLNFTGRMLFPTSNQQCQSNEGYVSESIYKAPKFLKSASNKAACANKTVFSSRTN